MQRTNLFIITVCLLSCGGTAAERIDFIKHVKPILEANCVSCHNPEKAKENGDLDLSTRIAAADTIVIHQAERSSLFKRVILDSSDKKLMPPVGKGGPLAKDQTEILKQWINEGAEWPEAVTLKTVMRIDFVRDIQPLLEKGGPFDAKAKEILRAWLDQGAVWPEGVRLGGIDGKKTPSKEEVEELLVAEIHKKILANGKPPSKPKPYSEALTKNVSFDMVPIPAGKFVMGSPDGEKGRRKDEGPQHNVKLDAFWMGKCEVTWDEYELFMYQEKNGAKAGEESKETADITAHPTIPYVEMSFGMGKQGFPAISMTQHAANKYCEWLSAKTGHFYRLPTEAEWEYACRAGTKTTFSFGNDDVSEYAWFSQNSMGNGDTPSHQKVGQKKPNPWGLHDMHGNVAEWCLDQYDPTFYAQGGRTCTNPWNKATKPYPHSVRGGSWMDELEDLRSAARRFSGPEWKQQDPQLPKSIWFLTDAQFLGFRVIRPLKIPSKEEMLHYWNNGVETE